MVNQVFTVSASRSRRGGDSMAPARSPGDWANESFRPKQMGRMTWEQAPEWVQALGKHHSELLREAIVALKRDSVDFRQMLLSVGETRYDVDRERSINWSYNIQDLADAGEDTLNSQLVEQRSHEAYLETLSACQLAVVLSHGEVRAARGTTRLRDVLQSGALPPQIRRLARLLSRSEVEAALRELDNPEVAAHNRLVLLGRTTTSGELRELVYSAVSKHDRVEAQRVTHNASWDVLVRPSSRYRVRAAGSTEDQARVLLSPSVCGTLPGDELSDSDLLCAADARAILRSLVPPLQPRSGHKFLLIAYGTYLNEAARLVRGAVLVDELAAPLLHVVAADLDTGESKPVATALQRAVASTRQHGSRMQVCPHPPPPHPALTTRTLARLLARLLLREKSHASAARHRRPIGGRRYPRSRASFMCRSSARAAHIWSIPT